MVIQFLRARLIYINNTSRFGSHPLASIDDASLDANIEWAFLVSNSIFEHLKFLVRVNELKVEILEKRDHDLPDRHHGNITSKTLTVTRSEVKQKIRV